MNKPTFEEFLKNIYRMSLHDYSELDYHQQKAIEIDYKDSYGKSINWWE